MNILSLVQVVNENALRIMDLIAKEIDLVDTKGVLSVDDRLYALAMFYRAAIIDLETKVAVGPAHEARQCAEQKSPSL